MRASLKSVRSCATEETRGERSVLGQRRAAVSRAKSCRSCRGPGITLFIVFGVPIMLIALMGEATEEGEEGWRRCRNLFVGAVQPTRRNTPEK